MGGEKEADLQREAEVRESGWAESLALEISATLLPFRYSSQYIPISSLAGSGWVSVTGNQRSMTLILGKTQRVQVSFPASSAYPSLENYFFLGAFSDCPR